MEVLLVLAKQRMKMKETKTEKQKKWALKILAEKANPTAWKKRPRGRPPKSNPLIHNSLIKRPRGRPRKSVPEILSSSVPKRGRPRKVIPELLNNSFPRRSVGRPRKIISDWSVETPAISSPKRGRPRKITSEGTIKPDNSVGQPDKLSSEGLDKSCVSNLKHSVERPQFSDLSVKTPPKRGRPRKIRSEGTIKPCLSTPDHSVGIPPKVASVGPDKPCVSSSTLSNPVGRPPHKYDADISLQKIPRVVLDGSFMYVVNSNPNVIHVAPANPIPVKQGRPKHAAQVKIQSTARVRPKKYNTLSLKQKLQVYNYARIHGVAAASQVFKVGKSTVQQWVTKGVRARLNRSDKSYSKDLEDDMVDYILQQKCQSKSITVEELCMFAESKAKDTKPDFKASRAWAKKLLKRHEHVVRKNKSVKTE